MKLIFAQYLAGLKERGELDVIMPDLLSEIGLNVISKPARGTKQYGVDVAAVGTLPGGVRSLFLLSIKPGDLTRSDWNTGAQALRPSLDQVLDVYIQSLNTPMTMPVRSTAWASRLPPGGRRGSGRRVAGRDTRALSAEDDPGEPAAVAGPARHPRVRRRLRRPAGTAGPAA